MIFPHMLTDAIGLAALALVLAAQLRIWWRLQPSESQASR
jgi:hypothetical protein